MIAFKFGNPNIEIAEISEDKKYGRFVIEPLERGYGVTIGNSLRRILLSSLNQIVAYFTFKLSLRIFKTLLKTSSTVFELLTILLTSPITLKYFFKLDIRTVGSKNAGSTNMLRTFGKRAALTVLFLDFIRGFFITHLG